MVMAMAMAIAAVCGEGDDGDEGAEGSEGGEGGGGTKGRSQLSQPEPVGITYDRRFRNSYRNENSGSRR